MEEVFKQIYHKNSWGSQETPSGDGSTLFNTSAIREELPLLSSELKIQSVLDIPCGDFHWMQEVAATIKEYHGADIVRELVELNRMKYGSEQRTFLQLDITNDNLPKVDLILCRDCFVHFSFNHIFEALDNILRSSSTYLLATTFTDIEENIDIVTGDWRPINLQQSPFHFPEPLRLIKEHRIWDGGECSDKALGLWRISDLPINRNTVTHL